MVVSIRFDVLDRIKQAVAMVKERMRRTVAARVARVDPAAVRTTVDVDILIEWADLPWGIEVLEAVGFIHSFTFGKNFFVDGPQGKAREQMGGRNPLTKPAELRARLLNGFLPASQPPLATGLHKAARMRPRRGVVSTLGLVFLG